MPSVTLSSVGNSAAIALDYVGAKGVSFAVTASTSGTVSYTIQGTLDDPMRVTSPTWFSLSSANLTASTTGIASVPTPMAAIRLSATGLSSTLLTLQYLQNVGG